eukprot:4972918-Prymnesium_polylepis.1
MALGRAGGGLWPDRGRPAASAPPSAALALTKIVPRCGFTRHRGGLAGCAAFIYTPNREQRTFLRRIARIG